MNIMGFILSLHPSSSSLSEQSSESSLEAVAGSVTGAVIILVAVGIIILLFVIIRKLRERANDPTYTQPTRYC